MASDGAISNVPCEECYQSNNHMSTYMVDDLTIENAVRLGHVNCLKTCLAAGADVDTRKLDESYNELSKHLFRAVNYGHNDCVETLIKAGAIITYDT